MKNRINFIKRDPTYGALNQGWIDNGRSTDNHAAKAGQARCVFIPCGLRGKETFVEETMWNFPDLHTEPQTSPMEAQEAKASLESIRERIGAAIGDMLYLSESEAGLELLPASDSLHSQKDVESALGAVCGTVNAATFLASIRSSIDPTDDGLKAYLAQWESLFDLLKSYTPDIRIYRSGADPVSITIAAIVPNDVVMIRTTSVET
jgi:hypothetical protein